MRIKLLKPVTVGERSRVRQVGWVGNVDDAEAKALCAVQYAKETTEECTPESPDPYDIRAAEAAASLGDKPSIYDADADTDADADKAKGKVKGDAPSNKAKK